MEKNKDNLDHFLNRLDELNIKMCPFMDMEEKYCQDYKNEVEDLRGGFCTCQENCNTCQKKIWNDDNGIYVDKDYYKKEEERKEKERLLKLERENHKIVEWIKKKEVN